MSEANIELVRRHYSTFNDGDMEGLMATVAPDAEFVTADDAATGRLAGESWEGADAVRALFERIYAVIRNPYLDVIGIEATPDDRVIGTVYLSGVTRETRLAYTFAAVHVFTLSEGLIVRNEIHHAADPER
jgi:ketosteroid isomerase-like protein